MNISTAQASKSKGVLIGIAVAVVLPIHSSGEVTRSLTTDADWRYYKGTTEPATTWNIRDFDDSKWAFGSMPFVYGTAVTQGTQLNDMRANYSNVFLRCNFTNYDAIAITSLELCAESDSAFIVWINGVEAWRMTNALASSNNASICRISKTSLEKPANFFVNSTPGTQSIAVQVINSALDGSHFQMNLRIDAKNMFAANAIKVACVGSSTTQGHDTYLGSYPMILQTLLGAGYEVRNYGHNGTRLIRQLLDKSRPLNVSYTDNPVIGREWYDSVAWQPDIVCIQLGVNDTSTNCDWNAKKHLFESEYDYLVASYTNRPGPRPRICIEPPSWVATNNNPHPVNGWAWTDDGNVANGQVVQKARSYATSRGWELIDVYHATYGHWPEYYLANGADPLHLSPLGNRVVAQGVAESIKNPPK